MEVVRCNPFTLLNLSIPKSLSPETIDLVEMPVQDHATCQSDRSWACSADRSRVCMTKDLGCPTAGAVATTDLLAVSWTFRLTIGAGIGSSMGQCRRHFGLWSAVSLAKTVRRICGSACASPRQSRQGQPYHYIVTCATILMSMDPTFCFGPTLSTRQPSAPRVVPWDPRPACSGFERLVAETRTSAVGHHLRCPGNRHPGS